MPEYIHLIGAEDIRSASHNIRNAGDEMSRAANQISESVDRMSRVLNDFLDDFRRLLEKQTKPTFIIESKEN
jgi:hypothetical protein